MYTKKSSTNVSTIYLDFDGRAMVEYQSNGTSTYLHGNWQGSALVATGSGGQTLWREHYDPYGQRLSGTGGKKGYTGHSYDGETKLTYMLARYYDAEVGRFLATDPIGSGDDLNVYGYVRGDPVNGTDPTGMTTWSERAGMDGIGWGGSFPGFDVTNGLSDEQILAIAINDSAGTVENHAVSARSGPTSRQRSSPLQANPAPTRQYPTADAAAIDAEKIYNPESKRLNREFMGSIYEKVGGKCCFIQTPNIGTADSSSSPPLPNGARSVAEFHTHGAYDPRYDSENFSSIINPGDPPGDIEFSKKLGVPYYLGTPSGSIKKYDPSSGQITVFPQRTN